MRTKSIKSQRGAEIVEFIVTLPVILILLGIIFDSAVAFSDQAILTQATRSAAREVIRGATDGEAQAAADQITQTMMSLENGDPLPAIVVVRAGANPGDQVTVTTTYNYGFLVLPSFLSTLTGVTLTSRTAMTMMPT